MLEASSLDVTTCDVSERDPAIQQCLARANMLFDLIDVKNRNALSEDDILEILAGPGSRELIAKSKEIGVPSEFLVSLLDNGDEDGDGLLTREEFVDYMKQKELFLISAFRSADTDMSGELDLDEFKIAMENLLIPEEGQFKKLKKSVIRKLMITADQDGDGDISYLEFREAFMTITMRDMENVKPFWADTVFGIGPVIDPKIATADYTFGHNIAAGIACAVASTMVSPLNIAATLVTSGRVAMATRGPNAFALVAQLWQQEGLSGMFKGNLCHIMANAPKRFLEWQTFHVIRNLVSHPDEGLSVQKIAMIGGLSSIAAMAFLYPLDVISTRFAVTRGVYKSLRECVKRIYILEGGIPALYAGLLPSCVKTLITISTQYITFQECNKATRKRALRQGQTQLTDSDYLSSSMVASFLALLVSMPLETITRRMQVQCIGIRQKEYFDIISASMALNKQGLFKGFGLMVLRDMPCMLVAAYVYNEFKGEWNDWNKEKIHQ